MGWPLPWKPKLIVDCCSLCFKRHRGKQGKKNSFAAPDAFLGVLKGWSVTTAFEIVMKTLNECAAT